MHGQDDHADILFKRTPLSGRSPKFRMWVPAVGKAESRETKWLLSECIGQRICCGSHVVPSAFYLANQVQAPHCWRHHSSLGSEGSKSGTKVKSIKITIIDFVSFIFFHCYRSYTSWITSPRPSFRPVVGSSVRLLVST